MSDMKVTFYDEEQENLLIGFTNIVCMYEEKWVLVREKNKTTWELPGGHREEGESPLDCAKRELYEETGIRNVPLDFLCTWKIENTKKGTFHYGNVYTANVGELGQPPHSEIEAVDVFRKIPANLTYPFIQADILSKAKTSLSIKNYRSNRAIFRSI